MSLLEEFMRSIELWLKFAKKQEPVVNPDLDPVLLVPGIAGSILHAVDDDDGKQERVWVRILGADNEFRKKLWSRFDPSTGKTVSFDEKTKIVVPEDRFGLYAIDVLDPDMLIAREGVSYYHDMIVEMINWGYQEGKTLFGFGYDFRQSNRLQETLDKFAAKLELVFTSSGGRKINLVTHSMGGLLAKCFISLHADVFEKYVKNWIAIAAPFQGAPGYITTSLVSGVSFVEGWEENFFISKWSMHQLLIECPSIYELMANPSFTWEDVPFLQIWKGRRNNSGQFNALLESYEASDAIRIMNQALLGNKVSCDGIQVPLPFNLEVLKWANDTHKLLSSAKIPDTIKFYNIYGINVDTAHSVCYGSEQAPIAELEELLCAQPTFICVNGDGTVPAESAKADGLRAAARVAVHASHRGIVCDRHVFRILQSWLNAGEPDPFYNPINDYVILPTAFEIDKYSNEKQQDISKEEWELVSPDDNDADTKPAIDLQSMVGALSRSLQEEQQQLHMAEAQVSAAIQTPHVSLEVAISG
ncbi:Lecithin-cholesterol acyltransferase-like 4 [Apostasia shenzhenica]|uniref:Lecithin-cholesterol acyltransferase-like 4 n=1 Tax=Apostasia shenzhenica TaxID=1088818 RepID=A0A2I0A9P3_9ASPA|nr:Lecithin-cholesterol acyltransferase-like 4 [Apostasia shenzhenica]